MNTLNKPAQSFSAEIGTFRALTMKVYMAYFIRHEVSKYQTFAEALPFIQRTVSGWTMAEFMAYVNALELQHETRHISQDKSHAAIRLHA
ncbi:MAG: hypothetical protein RBS36_04300 [Thiomicrospira sp.]|jgi:hypothetical protein|nr:hypothetical protein [Thiomicrospira sp.]